MELSYKTYALELRDPWSIASRQGVDGNGLDIAGTVFVRLVDPRLGLDGLGEASPVPYYGESPESVLAFVHALDPEKLSFAEYAVAEHYVLNFRPGEMAAKCALCCALADGAAKLRGSSLRAFAGLDAESGPAVHSSFTIGLARPEVIERKAAAAAEFPLLKLKVGTPNDLENLAALRRAAPDALLRIDANEAWTDRETALRRIEAFAQDPGIEFVEQPMPASAGEADAAWLKARSPLPLYADEAYHTADDIERAAGGFHGVNVKLVKSGGPIAAVKALQAARARGLQTMLGCMIESSWLISAAAQLAGLADTLDLDGAALAANDPFCGATIPGGILDATSLNGTIGVGATLREPLFMKIGWRPCR